MEKNFSRILIDTLIFAAICGLLYFSGFFTMEDNFLTEINTSVKENYDYAQENGEIDDVEGYGLLFEGAFAGLANFAGIIVLVLLGIVVPFGGLFGMVMLQIIARLFQIGENKKWKNITSFIITIISLIIQLTIAISYMYIVPLFNISKIMVFIILPINIVYTYLVINELKTKPLNIVKVVSEEKEI